MLICFSSVVSLSTQYLSYLEYTRSVQKVSIHVLWKIETFIEEDTRNIVLRTMTPQSPSKWAPWNLRQFSQSPSTVLSYFPESHWKYEISSLSKVILVLGKARSRRALNPGCSGAESPGWFDVSPKNSARDMMHEQVHCCDEAANHKLPTCGLLNHSNSFSGGMFKLNAKLDADSLLYSVILNAMVTRYTCPLNSVYHPHWLVQ